MYSDNPFSARHVLHTINANGTYTVSTPKPVSSPVSFCLQDGTSITLDDLLAKMAELNARIDELNARSDDAISPMPPKSVQVVKRRFYFAGKRPPSHIDHDDVMEE